jgi:hypothetical protein
MKTLIYSLGLATALLFFYQLWQRLQNREEVLAHQQAENARLRQELFSYKADAEKFRAQERALHHLVQKDTHERLAVMSPEERINYHLNEILSKDELDHENDESES